jgi:predicted regulator of Ras-like GTPase activity (Roadblock/LC7/MglB family)
VGVVGQYTSITIGADGLPIISYAITSSGDLKVAHCDNAACSSAAITTLDSTGGVGRYTSITIGVDGLPIISYYDDTNDNLKVAHCANPACTTATLTTLDGDGDVGQYTAITIGADGLPVISYLDVTNFNLKVAHCDNPACTTATLTTLDSGGDVGWYTAIAIGADGLPIISYHETIIGDGNLKIAHCDDPACTTATLTTVDSTNIVGSHTAITIGADGLPIISYFDFTTHDLKVAKLGSVFGTSFFRRR